MIHGVTPEVLEQRYKQLVVASDKLKYTITEDIKNINGALLVKSGKSIDQATCEKLLNHKLKGPLDDLDFERLFGPDFKSRMLEPLQPVKRGHILSLPEDEMQYTV